MPNSSEISIEEVTTEEEQVNNAVIVSSDAVDTSDPDGNGGGN